MTSYKSLASVIARHVKDIVLSIRDSTQVEQLQQEIAQSTTSLLGGILALFTNLKDDSHTATLSNVGEAGVRAASSIALTLTGQQREMVNVREDLVKVVTHLKGLPM